MANFGPNQFFGKTVTESSLPQLENHRVSLTYRWRALPWSSATTITDEISKQFDDIIVFPDAELWRKTVRPR